MNKNLNTVQIGQQGETDAGSFLAQKGYEIIRKNYRFKKSEVDLIAKQDDTMVFIEVKKRKNGLFGNPEEAVNDRKARLIHAAAINFVEERSWTGHIRFDIVAITDENICHFEDAF
ncbi:MAG: YraN family protein [Cytophagales bacterium]